MVVLRTEKFVDKIIGIDDRLEDVLYPDSNHYSSHFGLIGHLGKVSNSYYIAEGNAKEPLEFRDNGFNLKGGDEVEIEIETRKGFILGIYRKAKLITEKRKYGIHIPNIDDVELTPIS